MMKLTRKELRLLNRLLSFWVGKGLLSHEASVTLSLSVEEKKSGWQLLARYAFYCALCSGVLSVVAVAMDNKLIDLLLALFDTSAFTKSACLAVVAFLVFLTGCQIARRHPERLYSRELVYFLGSVFVGSSIAFLGEALDTGSGHYSLLLLLAFLVYVTTSIIVASKTVWVLALLSLIGWLLTETDYQSGDSLFFYGMNMPVRFAVFSVMLLSFSYLLPFIKRTGLFFELTKVIGLLGLLSGLWGIAIFGNHGDWVRWSNVSQFELWRWNFPLAFTCVIAIWIGVKWDDFIYRQLGICFILLLLYTLYVEYAWDHIHKALFFALLGLSFWVLSRFAEKKWIAKKQEPA